MGPMIPLTHINENQTLNHPILNMDYSHIQDFRSFKKVNIKDLIKEVRCDLIGSIKLIEKDAK